MILVDTSIWVDHLRKGDTQLANLLSEGKVLCHPLIVAEIALGSLKSRADILSLLDALPSAPVATVEEVRFLIEKRRLHSRGIGYVDACLLASCLIGDGVKLWTRDRRLQNVADEIDRGAGQGVH